VEANERDEQDDRDEKDEKRYFRIGTEVGQEQYESKNEDTILLRRSDMFWKAVGNSAVMLKNMGIETTVHASQIEKVKEHLLTKCDEVLRDDTSFLIVRMG